MPILKIPQKNLELEVPQGINLMDALLFSHLPVASSCHGEGICSKCVVEITPRQPAQGYELQVLEKNNLPPHKRLSCQVIVDGDLTVQTTYW